MKDDRFSPEEGSYEATPILSLNVEDDKLIKFIDNFKKNAEKFYDDKKNIKKRREVIKRFYFGKQVQNRQYEGIFGTRKIENYEKEYSDNVLKEGEDILRPLVLSRLPDIIVNPGVDSQMDRSMSEDISESINKTLQSDELKKLLTKAFRHHPIYFTAVIKWKWNPNKGKLGDIEFEVVNPENIIMDYMATDNDEEGMRVIIHFVEKSLFEWIMLFPGSEDDLNSYASKKGNWDKTTDPDGRTTNIKIEEVWFDWPEKVEEFDKDINPKYDHKSGVLWKLGKGSDAKILKKSLNPNWDWEGEERFFFNDKPVSEELIPQLAYLGFDVQGIQRERVYRNYFGRPRKPFIFMGYEQYGEMPLDETSRIEENLLLQQNYDTRGMQITKMIDDAKGKSVFSSLSGLKRETVEKMDDGNPRQALYVDGDLRQVHSYIRKEQPSVQMFNDLDRTRDRILSKIHISAPTRGEIQTSTATTNQIARESDYNVADDIASLTINEVATKMAEALLHLMKLRYTTDHFKALIGKKGEEVHDKLSWDIIEDGMEVTIKASGTDKLRIERQAKEEAAAGLGDPVSYYEDTGRPDPKRRAEMSFLYTAQPELYFKRFIKEEEIPQIAQGIMQQNEQNLMTAQGQQPPMQPSPAQTENIPTIPQSSPRGLIGKAGGAINRILGR
jgi:hypothetical protein